MFTGKPPWCEIEDQVSALFHIAQANSGPALPEYLEPEVQEFLKLCFTQDAKQRPNATQLLEHEWLKNKSGDKSPSTKSTPTGSATNSPRTSSPRSRRGSLSNNNTAPLGKGKLLINILSSLLLEFSGYYFEFKVIYDLII